MNMIRYGCYHMCLVRRTKTSMQNFCEEVPEKKCSFCRLGSNNPFIISNGTYPPVPVATRSKAQVCGRSPTEIVGSHPIGGVGLL